MALRMIDLGEPTEKGIIPLSNVQHIHVAQDQFGIHSMIFFCDFYMKPNFEFLERLGGSVQ